jgi:hypothetical protein
MWDALTESFLTRSLSGSLYFATYHSTLNFALIGGSYEASIYLGSMISAAPVPGSKDTTYREWYTDAACRATSKC